MMNSQFIPTFLNRAGNHTPAMAAFLLAGCILAAALMVIPSTATLAKSEPAHVAADLKQVNVNDGFAKLVKAVKPAVVNISVTGTTTVMGPEQPFDFENLPPQIEKYLKRFFGEQFNQGQKGNQNRPIERKSTAVGSGFIIDPAGLVVTNYHVIKDADEIEVVLDYGTRVPAELKGVDQKTDLALLEIRTDHALPYVVFGDSNEAEVGDWVIAIGNPFGLGGTTTSGIISARGRNINAGPLDDFIQIDAPINRGNSGGPLFNTKGEVIGVNSVIFSPNGGSVGIGFAIPSSMADNVVSQLAESGTVQRGYLGVGIQSVTDEIAASLGREGSHGALVTQVYEDTPAQRAGIEAGDIILSFGGREVEKMQDLPKIVALTEKDRTVAVEIWRNEARMSLDVVVGSHEESELAENAPGGKLPEKALGLYLAGIENDHLQQFGLDEGSTGVVIVEVDPDSQAEQRGLREGDIIKRVGKTDVFQPEDVIQAIDLSRQDNKEWVLLLVERNKQTRFIAVPVSA
ncbi:MAG: Do family serine endopeptidase [Gammaproteobacteria bacterium]|nr:Do family serine endopeptidase [Gammaproteobacteria bacterium]